MNIQGEELTVNGVTYVPKSSQQTMAVSTDGLPYVIVRTQAAGVFAGYLKERNGADVILIKARRLWYWEGAASLSQLAVDGVSKPKSCKFPCEVPEIEVTRIEIIPCSDKACKSIASVEIWKA